MTELLRLAKAHLLTSYDRLIVGLGYLFAFLLCAMAVLITIDVAVRSLRVGNLPWLNETSEYALYAGTFLAAPWVLRLGAHVRIDILATALPIHISRRLEQFVDVLGGSVSGTLFFFGCLGALEAYQFGHMQFKTITLPNWPLLSIFAFSMLLLVIEFALRFGRAAQPDAVHDDGQYTPSGL